MQFQTEWGTLIAWYLFLAGVGAGAYLVGFFAERAGDRYSPLVKPGFALGAPLVTVGSLLLLFHLGNPLQVWRGILRPYSSMMSLGIWILLIFIILSALHFGKIVFPKVFTFNTGVMSWIKGIAAVFALLTILYTGLLLGVIKAIPFWNTPILPVLFLVSALSTGIGAVVLIVGLQRLLAPKSKAAHAIGDSIHSINRIELPLIVTELLVLFLLLFIMIAGSTIEAGSARYLVSGGYAVAFWLGIVVVGLLVPFTLEAQAATRAIKLSGVGLSAVAIVSALCLLIGGLVMRHAILAAGAKASGLL